MSTRWVRTTAWLLFFALACCYLALAPGTTLGRGYVPDDMAAGLGMLASFNAWVKGRPVPPLTWTRHGPVPVLMDLPFLKLGKLFVTPDFVLSLSPLLFTAALMALVYLWLSRFCTAGMSLVLTLIGAFATMLWPYAYIGLEPKQSFFVVWAGYLALACGPIRTWRRMALFAIVCGAAISTKSTGVVLGPAVAYLVYAQFRGEWRKRRKQLAAAVLITGGIWVMSAVGWNYFWAPRGGGPQTLLNGWVVTSVFQVFTNAVGLFGSPGKGLFVFAPILLIAIYAVPRAFRSHRDLVVFALLAMAGTAALLSILTVFADEVWGPRFMHVAIAPLLLVIGAAWPRLNWRIGSAVAAVGAVGLAVSFLGAFYYYGARGWAAEAAGQNTLEWYGGDKVWNEVQFDAMLFSVWLKGGTDPVLWTPTHIWVWSAPADAKPWKTVNLREYAAPQSFLLYYWNIPLGGSELLMFRTCAAGVVLGPLFLALVIARTIRMRAAAPAPAALDDAVAPVPGRFH